MQPSISPLRAGCQPAGHESAALAELSTELGRHAKLLHVLKAKLAPHAPQGLDYAAVSVLFTLYRRGPLRQGELADAAMLDRSTISRYVTQLVKAGLVGRQPDAADGRAVQLVVTTQGEEVGRRFVDAREDIITGILADWSPSDIETLTTLMRKLNDEFERLRPGTG